MSPQELHERHCAAVLDALGDVLPALDADAGHALSRESVGKLAVAMTKVYYTAVNDVCGDIVAAGGEAS